MGIKVCVQQCCVWGTIYFRQLLQGFECFHQHWSPDQLPGDPECALFKDTRSETSPWGWRKRFKGGCTDRNFTPKTLQTQLPSGYNSSKCQGVPEIPLIFHSCHIIITFCLEAYTWHFQCLKIAYKRLEKAFHQVMEHQDEWKCFLAERGQN